MHEAEWRMALAGAAAERHRACASAAVWLCRHVATQAGDERVRFRSVKNLAWPGEPAMHTPECGFQLAPAHSDFTCTWPRGACDRVCPHAASRLHPPPSRLCVRLSSSASRAGPAISAERAPALRDLTPAAETRRVVPLLATPRHARASPATRASPASRASASRAACGKLNQITASYPHVCGVRQAET